MAASPDYALRHRATPPSRPLDDDTPVLATGHQPALWHPGILAKDMAMVIAARRLGAAPLHLVVDHDLVDAARLEVPVQRGDALEIVTLRLGDTSAAVPAGAQPPVAVDAALRTIDEARRRFDGDLPVDLSTLGEAIEATRGIAHGSLAEQVSAWIGVLMEPTCGAVPMIPSSGLLATDGGAQLVDAMLADARRCARCYNEAVAHHREAGVGPLLVERDRVELPMWSLAWNQPRQRVFADLADATPMLTFEDGTPLPAPSHDGRAGRWLAPRALLLTALMRSRFCRMFIHGKGGGAYDKATEHWWAIWRDEPLAPRAVVSADVHLQFDAPVSEVDDLARAHWYRHHVPFNVDRLLQLDGPLPAQKRRLIEQARNDESRRRRWLAFREIHRINDRLAAIHPEVVREAEQRLAAATQGWANRRVATKRDWCFGLYPPATLESLRNAIEHTAPLRR